MLTEALALPFACDQDAPLFASDDNESLLMFLDQFNSLVQEYSLLEEEKC